MTSEEEMHLVFAAQAGDTEARDQLWVAFRPLVIAMAKRCAYGTDLDDMIQEGMMGLLYAIHNCKKTFRAYAKYRIKKAMTQHRRRSGRHYQQLPQDFDDDERCPTVPLQLRSEPTQEVAVEVRRLTQRERAAVLWEGDGCDRTEAYLRARLTGRFKPPV